MKSRKCLCGRSLNSKKNLYPSLPHSHAMYDAYGCPYGYANGTNDEWIYGTSLKSPYIKHNNRSSSKSRHGEYHKSVYQYLTQSLAKSSINGISNCLSTKNNFGKFIWFVIFCLCACGFGYQASRFYSLYRSKPSVVQIEVENDGEVDFPAVTVCNTNRIRRSAFCKYFPERCKEGVIFLAEYEINEIIYNLMLEGKDDIKRDLGHNKSMIIGCDFVGKPILKGEQCMEIWEYFYDPDYGNCYTFTSKTIDNEYLQARKVDFWQEENELSLTIDLQPEESMEKKRSPGIIAVVHDSRNEPDIHTEGVHLMSGLTYSVPVAKSTVILLPLPFKTNCTDYLSLPWKNLHRNRLTSRTCTVGCSQYFQLKNCQYVTKNISLFYEKLPYKKKDVNEERKSCAIKEEKRTIDYCRSICGLPCRDSIYAPTVGASRLTGKEAEVNEAMAKRQNPNNVTFSRIFVHVRIFYSTLEHKIYRHIPKYNTMELFSYLGGYSGVWLGFSLLTVYELCEILFSTTLFFLRKTIYQKQHKRIAGTVMNSKKTSKVFKNKRYFN